MLFDFSAATVPDRVWATTRPAGTVSTFVDGKADSGSDRFSIARGEGRSGGDCLLVESIDDRAGLPGFWAIRGKTNGKIISTPRDREGYLTRNSERANRFAFDVRFDAGFRAKSSVTRTQNFQVGTYHYDPNKPGEVKESNNWHFYHQIAIRHDLAGGDWIRVVLNDVPQHQRSLSQYQTPKNPTVIAPYWEIATRLYLDCHPYHSDPEISRPVRMFVDNMEFYYEEPRAFDVRVPDSVDVSTKRRVDIPVLITNNEPADVMGTVAHRSRYSWQPKLRDESGADIHGKNVMIKAGETREFVLSFWPKEGMKIGTMLAHGMVFVPLGEQRPGNHSIADPRVMLHPSYGFSGPCDANIVGATTRLKVIE